MSPWPNGVWGSEAVHQQAKRLTERIIEQSSSALRGHVLAFHNGNRGTFEKTWAESYVLRCVPGEKITFDWTSNKSSSQEAPKSITRERLVPESIAKSFHAFEGLPIEIRIMIWRLAKEAEMEPRTITGFLIGDGNTIVIPLGPRMILPCSTLLQTSMESRNEIIQSYGNPMLTNLLFDPDWDTLRLIWEDSIMMRSWTKDLRAEAQATSAFHDKRSAKLYPDDRSDSNEPGLMFKRALEHPDGMRSVIYKADFSKGRRRNSPPDRCCCRTQFRHRRKDPCPFHHKQILLVLTGVPSSVTRVESTGPVTTDFINRENIWRRPEPGSPRAAACRRLTLPFKISVYPWSAGADQLQAVIQGYFDKIKAEGQLDHVDLLRVVVERYDIYTWPDFVRKRFHITG